MSDLLSLLSRFSPENRSATHIISCLEKHSITTSDLLTLDAVHVASRAGGLPVLDVRRFINDVIRLLHEDVFSQGMDGVEASRKQLFITTMDEVVDGLLGGGVPTGCVTEFVGESGTGKTQLLLSLLLSTQLPPHLGGLSRPTLYISTEAPLSTRRLLQILETLRISHPDLTDPPSTDKIHSITCSDLETQDHILTYQLPLLVEKLNIGLIVLDSIAANFRAEYERPTLQKRAKPAPSGGSSTSKMSGPAMMARRGGDLVKLAQTFRTLAEKYNLAVVVANQVSDRFDRNGGELDVMMLDYQAKWFTGWGDDEEELEINHQEGVSQPGGKVPALGLVWANLLGGRVVLKKKIEHVLGHQGGEGEEGAEWSEKWVRCMKVVFAGWVEAGRECDIEIWNGGLRGVGR